MFKPIIKYTIILIQIIQVQSQLNENDRVAEYNARKHTWPPKENEFIPNTNGWRRTITRRLSQIDRLVDTNDKYNALINCIHSGFIAPNFTELGWGLTKAPQDLVDELRESFHKGLLNNVTSTSIEKDDRAIEGNTQKNNYLPPLFYPESYELKQKSLKVLKPILESWTSKDLVSNNAYGYRIYRNGNIMNMHLDNANTHVISCILHIDHSSDSQPWPLVLEDFNGDTIEVVLESGDLLLYESSKLYHGRPKPFSGTWYTSLFLHYYPRDWNAAKIVSDTHYRIPPTWYHVLPEEKGLEKLVVVDTSVKEPECEYQWCSLRDGVTFSGPGRFGQVLTSSGKYSLELNDFEDGTNEL